MKDLAGIICIVGVVVLPVLLMWLHNRRKINETNQRVALSDCSVSVSWFMDY